MSFLRVTNIQDLNGSNTVAITSASSGNLIVKKELLGESGANFTGVGTINNIQIGAGIITAISGVVTFFGDIAPTDINISGAMTATGGFTGDLTGDLTGSVVGFGVSIVGVGSFSSARIAEGSEGGVTINESGIYLDQLAGVVTATTFDGNLTGTATTATNLADAANITTGTISDARLPDTITSNITAPAGTSVFDNVTVTGTLTGTATTLADASNITGGQIHDDRLPDIITSNINISESESIFNDVTVNGTLTGTATTATNIGITTQTLSFSMDGSTLTLTVNGVGSTSFTLS